MTINPNHPLRLDDNTVARICHCCHELFDPRTTQTGGGVGRIVYCDFCNIDLCHCAEAFFTDEEM